MPSAACFDFPLLKDEVSAIVQDAVLSTLEGNVYDHTKVNAWINQMTTSCVEDLRKLSPNFKYIVTCFIRQKKGAGVEHCSLAYWDEKTDGACTVSWENNSIEKLRYKAKLDHMDGLHGPHIVSIALIAPLHVFTNVHCFEGHAIDEDLPRG